MRSLLQAVTDLAMLVSPNRIEAIAGRVRTRGAADEPPNLESLVSTPAARSALRRVIEEWDRERVPGEFLAGLLVGASECRRQLEREQSIELVWTGPTTPYVPTRRTEQVLLGLIEGAQQDVFLVSFVVYRIPTVVEALSQALSRKIRVRLLFESSTAEGGSISSDPVASMKARVPAANVYVWRDRSEPFADGKVHAKVAVADGRVAFVTSANLTGHALEKNMEAGVLITGGSFPRIAHDHLQSLVDTGIVARV